ASGRGEEAVSTQLEPALAATDHLTVPVFVRKTQPGQRGGRLVRGRNGSPILAGKGGGAQPRTHRSGVEQIHPEWRGRDLGRPGENEIRGGGLGGTVWSPVSERLAGPDVGHEHRSSGVGQP